MAKRAILDNDQQTKKNNNTTEIGRAASPQLPADSPLRGFPGADAAFRYNREAREPKQAKVGTEGEKEGQNGAGGSAREGGEDVAVSSAKKKKKRKKKKGRNGDEGSGAQEAADVASSGGGGSGKGSVLNGSVTEPVQNGNSKNNDGLLSPGRNESSSSGGKSKARENGSANGNSKSNKDSDGDDRSRSDEIVVHRGRDKRGGGDDDTAEGGDDGGSVEGMSLEEIGGRLAQLLMVVRMVEEQSDLTAFLLPVELSVPANNDRGGKKGQKMARTGIDHPASAAAATGGGGDVSSSDSEADEDSDDDGDDGGRHKGGVGKRGGVGSGSKRKESSQTGKAGKSRLAIQLLRYHKKVRICLCQIRWWFLN